MGNQARGKSFSPVTKALKTAAKIAAVGDQEVQATNLQEEASSNKTAPQTELQSNARPVKE